MAGRSGVIAAPFEIREARPEDAAALLSFVRQLLAEPDIDVPLALDEFSYTEESERAHLAEVAVSGNSVFLLAIAGGEIIGEVSLRGGNRRATQHCAVLGIAVARGWRDRGVGSALMAHVIRWARDGGLLKRIELFVYARNARAIHLYEKFAFRVEGRRQRAVLHQGTYQDDLLMALLL